MPMTDAFFLVSVLNLRPLSPQGGWRHTINSLANRCQICFDLNPHAQPFVLHIDRKVAASPAHIIGA